MKLHIEGSFCIGPLTRAASLCALAAMLAACSGTRAAQLQANGDLVMGDKGKIVVAGGLGQFGGSSASVSGENTPGMLANDIGPEGADVGWFAGNRNLAPHALGFYDFADRGTLLATLGNHETSSSLTLLRPHAQFVAPSGACTGGHAFSNGIAVYSNSGAPTCRAAAGSLYLRSDGSDGARMYVSAGGAVWHAVPGV